MTGSGDHITGDRLKGKQAQNFWGAHRWDLWPSVQCHSGWFLGSRVWTKSTRKGSVVSGVWRRQGWKATQLPGRKSQVQEGPLTLPGKCKDVTAAPITKCGLRWEQIIRWSVETYSSHHSMEGANWACWNEHYFFQEETRLSSHSHMSVTPR